VPLRPERHPPGRLKSRCAKSVVGVALILVAFVLAIIAMRMD
jgi:hypothetical protein